MKRVCAGLAAIALAFAVADYPLPAVVIALYALFLLVTNTF